MPTWYTRPKGQKVVKVAATLAESTVKTHVKRILAKIDARDRAQAVVVAYRAGLMYPDGGS